MSGSLNNADMELFTDAAGSGGYGVFFQGKWSAGGWPDEWREAGWLRNLALLELFPIVLAVEIWGSAFRNKKVRFHCDNLGVVTAINNLVLLCLCLNVFVYAVHIPGVSNRIADALSRSQWKEFRVLAPEAEQHGTPCPPRLWAITSESPQD